MKVVSPEDTGHTIIFIPRTYTVSNPHFFFTNEATNVQEVLPMLPTTTDGITTFSFYYIQFNEGETYSFYIANGDETAVDPEIVYRGRMLVTTQETQSFDITKNYITY